MVMDLFSRQIVGWAMACWRPKPAEGFLHHNDRGRGYACKKYQKQIKQYGMIASMSRKGNCGDNAPTERFFGSLKSEHLADFRFVTRNEVKRKIPEYMTFYNVYRSHASPGCVSPMEYERQEWVKTA